MRVTGFRVADVRREGKANKVTKAPQIYPQPGEIMVTIMIWRRLQSKD
jgi:hypothetical protein